MTDTPEAGISKRRDAILAELAAAASPPPVLIAVSKTQPDEALEQALAAGQRIFGENRVQEAKSHWEARRERFPDLELHLIGPLQTNKAEEAVRLCDVIQTLDRPKLADALAAAIAKTGRAPRLLIQVNTGEEAQKAGVSPDGLPELIAHARAKGLEISGLMCIPPVGMSADYALAARYGATHVRVGTALFGERT